MQFIINYYYYYYYSYGIERSNQYFIVITAGTYIAHTRRYTFSFDQWMMNIKKKQNKTKQNKSTIANSETNNKRDSTSITRDCYQI